MRMNVKNSLRCADITALVVDYHGRWELNATGMIILQNRRNGDPTENKHARQSEK